MNYTNGTFKGRVTDYGIGETKGGEPKVVVSFEVEFPTGTANMKWDGHLNAGKAREITMKALVNTLGFRGRDIAELIDGPDSNAISTGREANLVIENEPYEGKDFYKIKWVNSLGGGMAIHRADAGSAKAKLAKLNMAGDLAKAIATAPDEPQF
jgi:hypothetical protein